MRLRAADEPNATGSMALAYRPEIDGLRAVAVVAVCLYHFDIGPFTGGFAGVDVFFVISGFLMAELIGRDLGAGRFNLGRFYERRARRIFPALFTILAFCTLAAALIIPPKMFQEFGRSLVATVLFSSNILFSINSRNYFDPPTALNPLLHTWSLAVEEQFYILFPIYLVLIWRGGPRLRRWLTASLALASLAVSVWGVQVAPTWTFYLLPSRAWELLVGALLSLFGLARAPIGANSRLIRELGAGAGLLLVGAGFLLIGPDTPFPGAAALAPCLGAACLIHFCAAGPSLVARCLGLGPVRAVGKISYSLYLWHWPLLVLVGKYGLVADFGLAARVLLLAVAVVLSAVTWRWVEQPFRGQGRQVSIRVLMAGSIVSLAVLILAGLTAQAHGGWSARFPGFAAVALDRQLQAEQRTAPSSRPERRGCFAVEVGDWGGRQCFLAQGRSTNALLWGDSFAASYADGLFENPRLTTNLLQYTSPQCPPLIGYAAASHSQCAPFDHGVEDVIRRYAIKTVLLDANWSSYIDRHKLRLEDLAATIARLHALGLHVILIGQSPNFSFVAPDEYLYRKFGADRSLGAFYAQAQRTTALNRSLQALGRPDEFFDPAAVLCRGEQCVFRDQGAYLVRDYGHYTAFGSRRMADALLRRTSLGDSAVGRR